MVEETYITERGRTRRRRVPVDLDAARRRLTAAEEADLAAWERARGFMRQAVGESTFEVWLAGLELIGVDVEGTLIVSVPAQLAEWLTFRFARVLDGAAEHAGRRLRVADEVQREAAEPLARVAGAPAGTAPGASPAGRFGGHVGFGPRAAAASVAAPPDGPRVGRGDQSTGKRTVTFAYPTSYTGVYTQSREVS